MPSFRTPLRSRYPFVRDLCQLIEEDPRTFAEISKKAGISHFTLLRWRAGKAAPSYDLAADLLQVLGAELRIVKKT